MVRHILVGFDGSDSARRAVRFAHELATQVGGARLTLLFVLQPPTVVPIGPLDSYLATGFTPNNKDIEDVRKLLDQAAADLPRAQVDKRVELGRAAETIVEQAQKLEADLIVVGARGLGAGGRWLLGSVSDRVVHHAGRPVTVVH